MPLELVAFADEEGLRFRSTFLGSRAYLGLLGRRISRCATPTA